MIKITLYKHAFIYDMQRVNYKLNYKYNKSLVFPRAKYFEQF